MDLTIRAARPSDLPSVLELWSAADVEPGHTDDLDSLERLIAHDPDSLLVADETKEIVGSIIAAWDGWRGSIYRLAVAPAHRRAGVARRLLREAEDRLTHLGAGRLQAIVVETDSRATGFWRASSWTEQVERLRFTRS